jgi:hypothetical protein
MEDPQGVVPTPWCASISLLPYCKLSSVPQAFHDISIEMQAAGVPLISTVIKRVDDLVRVIDKYKDDTSKHPAVRSAALRGLAILNKYYEKSDESFVYRISMALDPRFKLGYFVDQEWPKEWIDTVKDITRTVYQEHYSDIAPANLPASPRRPPAPSSAWPSLLREPSAVPPRQECDELAQFWALPRRPLDSDPLQYWIGYSVSEPESCLAQMAIDYLSAPASSVEAERAFSRGALTVTHRRHALSHQSTRNSIVLGAWLKDTNLVPREELVELFHNKPTRERLTTTSDSADADTSVESEMSL